MIGGVRLSSHALSAQEIAKQFEDEGTQFQKSGGGTGGTLDGANAR